MNVVQMGRPQGIGGSLRLVSCTRLNGKKTAANICHVKNNFILAKT